AATAADVIVACSLARRAIANGLNGAPDMTDDHTVQARIGELVAEAQITLNAIIGLASSDITEPLTDPTTLARAVSVGILDAPHLRNNPFALGSIVTRFDQRGASQSVDPESNEFLSEAERIVKLGL
ncbi:MAG: methionine synthase, partial [Anaerolineales bacterium]|nr:methionine synthase [Anaerolineales bacterium]